MPAFHLDGHHHLPLRSGFLRELEMQGGEPMRVQTPPSAHHGQRKALSVGCRPKQRSLSCSL